MWYAVASITRPMHLIARRIATLIPDWNQRPLDEADIFALCYRFDIGLVELPLKTDGFYFRVDGRDIIAVDSQLDSVRRLVVLLHELGHYLLHAPESPVTASFHGVGRRTREEKEADLVSLCGLIPRPILGNFDFESSAVPAAMWAQRLEIYKTHNL